ncbi:MAG: class I SAM-dependent methyltransferase [Thermoplasmata archaeon]|nr:MAG: class I SAM-dependent methyltransferase [Thermoplasmata archaeon]
MDKSEKIWDKIADNYDKSEKRFEPIHKKTIENTKKYLNSTDIVLDYGCATGTKALELASSVKRIQGIDISSKMIEAAKRKAVERKIENVVFTHAIIFDERYKRESFDVILAFNILHSLEGHKQVLKRINELLKPGGLFISVTPCLKEKMAIRNRLELSFFRLLIIIRVFPNILTRFKIPELEDLITSGNFQIIETENIFHRMTSYFVTAKKI